MNTRFDRGRGMGGHHSATAEKDTWLTPPDLLAKLGHFDCDPCCPVGMPWKTADVMYTIEDNGLMQPWLGRVWLNPPYGRDLATWLERMAEHDHGTALIFARTETQAFFRYVWEKAAAVLFLRGRLDFLQLNGSKCASRGNGNAGAPSVLVAYGADDTDVLSQAEIAGQFVPLRLSRAFLIELCTQSWPEVLSDFFSHTSGPVKLADLYRAFSSHPKAKRNPNYEAKLRQTLQKGKYQRVAPGVWQAEVSA